MTTSANQIRINYDDDVLDIIDRFNEALKPYGLKLESDGQMHDGYEILALNRTLD